MSMALLYIFCIASKICQRQYQMNDWLKFVNFLSVSNFHDKEMCDAYSFIVWYRKVRLSNEHERNN